MRTWTFAAAVVVAAALAGCGEDGLGELPGGGTETTTARDRAAPQRRERRRPRLKMARCPAMQADANCAAARGRVVYVESVDPDGDGDLHAVTTVTGGEAVSGPGLVIFDVRRDLRPKRDPRPGDEVTGWGPVFEGSHGQRQIQVEEFRVARR